MKYVINERSFKIGDIVSYNNNIKLITIRDLEAIYYHKDVRYYYSKIKLTSDMLKHIGCTWEYSSDTAIRKNWYYNKIFITTSYNEQFDIFVNEIQDILVEISERKGVFFSLLRKFIEAKYKQEQFINV